MNREKIYMRSIRSSGVGNCLLLHARRWGIDHQERKNCKILGVCRGGGGGMATGQSEPCINWEYFADMSSAISLFYCCKFSKKTIFFFITLKEITTKPISVAVAIQRHFASIVGVLRNRLSSISTLPTNWQILRHLEHFLNYLLMNGCSKGSYWKSTWVLCLSYEKFMFFRKVTY